MEDFRGWLERQIKLRNWSQAEFSRAGGVSVSMTSQFLKGSRGAGELIYQATARALDMPLVEVLRQAGVLPANGKGEHYAAEDRYILDLLKQLTPAQREEALSFVEFIRVRDAKKARG